MSFQPGSSVGPYRILAPLGAGGMGEVYRANDPRLGRDVAIKVLPPEFAADPERVHRFEKETRAVGSLNHPSLLTVFEVGTYEGVPYMVTELLEGQTLRERLRRGGAMPVAKAVEYAIQIAQGLSAAHEKRIVHRDLKPENVFVSPEGRVKILDFGLAKTVHAESEGVDAQGVTRTVDTTTGVILGTAGYMAPEQIRGEATDHRADLFNFGAVLYEMLAGRRAFEYPTSVETLNAILNESPAPLDAEIPPTLQRIVRRCLEKDPRRRFHAASDVAIDLEDLSLAPVTDADGKRPSAQDRRRRHVVVLALATLLVLVPVVFVIGRRTAVAPLPAFHRLTYNRGSIGAARFAPDGHTIVFSAAWGGQPSELFTMLPEGPTSRPLGLGRAELLSVSSQGELAIAMRPPATGGFIRRGTLARVGLTGGGVRELLENVDFADWTPDGKDLVVVRSAGLKARLELPAGHLLYEMVGWISSPRVSPDGSRVAFVGHPRETDAGFVASVDRSGNLRVLSDGWQSAYGLAWCPGGKEIWFTASETGSHRAIHGVTMSMKQRLVARVPGSLTLHDITREGRALVTLDAQGQEIQCLTPGSNQERSLGWLDWPLIVEISKDGRTLLFMESGEGAGKTNAVFIRSTDGAPAVRLGEGAAYALSPDGRWAFVETATGQPSKYALLPTGAGEPHPLDFGSIEGIRAARWLPDGRALLVTAHEPDHQDRVYVKDMPDGALHPLTPERSVGDFMIVISPDGSEVAVLDSLRRVWLYPLDGGAPRAVPSTLTDGEALIGFEAGGRSIFMNRWRNELGLPEIPQPIYRLDIETGRRTLWKTITCSDPAGVATIGLPYLTPDGKSYAFQHVRWLSQLYLVDNLH